MFGPADDADWHPFAGRLIIDHEAAVLPVRFDGKNSLLFQLASRLSPTLRLSLLLQEAARRIGTTVDAHLGDVLPFDRTAATGLVRGTPSTIISMTT